MHADSFADRGDVNDSDPWLRLMHRWLIEYNPLYLLSAALVLGGASLVSHGLLESGSLAAQLGVDGIAELYSGALIAGAALLTRRGKRRPAVMLALLAVLYQGDLTLHTETCAYLGAAGALGAALWLALFVAKIYALAWAMRLNVSRPAVALATLGATGVAAFPLNITWLDEYRATSLVGLWAFVTFAAGLHLPRSIESAVPLDPWGRTVFRRTVRATWILWGGLALLHVAFWAAEFHVDPSILVPLGILLAASRMRGAGQVWAAVTGTLVVTSFVWPACFSAVGYMAAGVLCLRALSVRCVRAKTAPSVKSRGPYRSSPESPNGAPATIAVDAGSDEPRFGLLAGALCSAYVATWTLGWTGGALPAHRIWLDLALTALLVVVAHRGRSWSLLAPVAAVYGHVALQVGWISFPRTAFQWGCACVGFGFALLGASLTASCRIRDPDQDGRTRLRHTA